MRLSRKRSVVAAIAVMAAFGVASAQPEQRQTAPDQGVPPPLVETGREVELSPQQRLTEGKSFMPPMEQASHTVRRMLEQARAARDVVKVLCLNDKLNQIDVALRSGRERMVELERAASNNDKDRSRHEFTVLQVLRDRVNTLIAEANQCIGEETGFIGDSMVTVDIDPTIPEPDPTQFGFDPGLILDSPIVSSPVQ